MAYPFAGFASFLFAREEVPVFGSDTGWAISPSVSRSRPLGGDADTILTLARGSRERSFEVWLLPSRYTDLEDLLLSTGQFTDWERPLPDARVAVLIAIQRRDQALVVCGDGVRRWKYRTSLTLITQ